MTSHSGTVEDERLWVLVPREPMPEMIAAWYRYKNGHHFADEPAPFDTSDYGAYRAMLAASPVTTPQDGTSEVVEAARAVIAQWDTPNWKLEEPTAAIVNRLRRALAALEVKQP